VTYLDAYGRACHFLPGADVELDPVTGALVRNAFEVGERARILVSFGPNEPKLTMSFSVNSFDLNLMRMDGDLKSLADTGSQRDHYR